jgi:hypothetical protein
LVVSPLGASISVIAAASLFVIFAVEATARRQLVPFVASLVIVVIGVVVVGTLVLGLLSAWRVTVAALFLGAAAIVAALNLSELRRQ